ncbi:MAG: GNAT family N-acetyltransferase [Pseudorhodoplanes sp.]|nr:GNAT family N-acetyltransferase [Pseudorhodoplanes sp.]
MQIRVIDNLQAFAELRAEWDRVYDNDPDAHFFLSWTWLSQWLPVLTGSWFILAAKPPGAEHHVAFLPLRVRLRERKQGGFHNEIYMAGNYQADYTGFICMPEFDKLAIPALAKYVGKSPWARVNLDNIRTTDERLRLFLNHFPDTKFVIKRQERINKPENINNCICPLVTLPDNWETYLNNNLGSETRRTVKRFMKRVGETGDLRITHADATTIERDVKILLRLWTVQWGKRKGDRLQTILRSNFQALTRAFAGGSLFLPIMWNGDTPVGAQATFIDPAKRSLLAFMGGRDETFGKPSPGIVLHAHSIQYAIENGFTTYDFLRGNEAYKYSFGVQERRIFCAILSTKNGRNPGDKLDTRTIPEALERATRLHKSGHFARAEQAYRQIIETDPKCEDALYRLGQLKASTGSHGTAKRIFKSLVAIKPDSEKAWLRLGHSLEARRRFSEAADAYREVITRHPNLALAHNKLGNVLFKAGHYEEAINAFEKAVSLQPGYLEAEVSKANTLHMLGRLPRETQPHYAALNAKLGDKFREAGAVAFAVHCYQQALKMHPELVVAHYGLGLAFHMQRETEKAVQSYRHVVALDPHHRDAMARLFELAPSPAHPVSVLHANP